LSTKRTAIVVWKLTLIRIKVTTFFFTLFFAVAILWMFKKPKEQIEYEKKLDGNLAEEYIIDPETGAKLTLEQAESGHWVDHTNEHLQMSESEIEKLYTEEEKNIERAANLLIGDIELKRTKFSDEQIERLEKTVILKKYDAWNYYYCFHNTQLNFYIFFPTVEIQQKVYTHYPDNFVETQIMFWIDLKQQHGHYYLRQKSTLESIFNHFNLDAKSFLKDYLTLVQEPSDNPLQLLRKVKPFEKIPNLEIEVSESDLLIKNREWVSTAALKKLLDAVKTCV
jgi:hypothetical protein